MPASTGIQPGHGVIELVREHAKASFTIVSFRYPLKLLLPTPPGSLPFVGAAYMLSYGGGLVDGDSIDLSVSIDTGCTLLLLTQGSTKVFKPVAPASDPSLCAQRQHLTARVAPHGTLVLLPSPVTCFARSSYAQLQRVDLADPTASVVLLDWLTSGRRARGEHWHFARYRSELVVRRVAADDRVHAHDVLLLEGDDYAADVEPYACYATLLLVGPAAARARDGFASAFEAIRFPAKRKAQTAPDVLLWSYSPIGGDGTAGIVRAAGMTTEAVRDFLKDGLASVRDVVGDDLFASAWA
jgi:urease accessory protein